MDVVDVSKKDGDPVQMEHAAIVTYGKMASVPQRALLLCTPVFFLHQNYIDFSYIDFTCS